MSLSSRPVAPAAARVVPPAAATPAAATPAAAAAAAALPAAGRQSLAAPARPTLASGFAAPAAGSRMAMDGVVGRGHVAALPPPIVRPSQADLSNPPPAEAGAAAAAAGAGAGLNVRLSDAGLDARMTDGKSRMGDIGALGVVGAAGVAGAGAVMLPSIGPLKVVKQAQNQLAYTNCVYVSATLIDPFPMADNTFVMINGRVFVVRPHDAMQAGAIGLNFMQRTTLGLENGDLVTVAIWTPPLDPTFNLCGARIEFETHEAGLARLSFKEDDMLPLLKSAFAGQILSVGQSFFGQMGNLAIKYQVKSLDAPTRDDQDSKKKGHITRSVNLGMLTAATKIKLAVKPGNKMVLLEESDERPPIFDPNWSFADMGIGGLDAEFGVLFRRAFASRLFPPTVIESLGIKHVKGMLLYGPPGTGKTLIARQIGKLLKGKEPKVVNGPEILNKFVGESEANVRALFKDAEADEKGNGKTLHIIIFDEIDAICKQRGTMSGSTGVHDTVVNQLLSKIDGVNSLNNILVIGMTNRKDMIDSALLRPGRLEVHIEIGLPDAHGREQILNIHTKKMRENKKLDDDVSIRKLAEATKNFSGAELEGLVKSASSFALYQCVDVGGIGNGVDVSVKPEDIVVNMAHFERALMEVTPAFGIADDELKTLVRGPLIDYSAEFERLKKIGMTWVGQVRNSRQTPLLSVLLEGAVGAGKTALAGKLAIDSDFAFTKVISPEMFVGFSEQAKCAAITKVFDDAYKCPLSCVILDNIERLVEYVALGPRFGNQVLQTLLVLIKRVPPGAPDRKLLILATTSSLSLLRDMEFHQTFNVVAHMPSITRPDDIVRVFEQADVHIDEKEMNTIAANMPLPVGIKQLLMIIEMATVAGIRMTAARFLECIRDSGLDARRTPNRSTTQSDTS